MENDAEYLNVNAIVQGNESVHRKNILTTVVQHSHFDQIGKEKRETQRLLTASL